MMVHSYKCDIWKKYFLNIKILVSGDNLHRHSDTSDNLTIIDFPGAKNKLSLPTAYYSSVLTGFASLDRT